MSENKPPMTVWLDDESCHALDCCLHGTCEDHEGDTYHVGPYVHLDQFLAEVERRADAKHATTMRQYSSDFMEAMQELAKEIMEGKE